MYAECMVAARSAYALFYRSCPASHNIHRVKLCVKAFLCPTVGGDCTFSHAHYILLRGCATQ